MNQGSGAGTEGVEEGDEIVDVDHAIAASGGDVGGAGCGWSRTRTEGVEEGDQVVDVDYAVATCGGDISGTGRRLQAVGNAISIGIDRVILAGALVDAVGDSITV